MSRASRFAGPSFEPAPVRQRPSRRPPGTLAARLLACLLAPLLIPAALAQTCGAAGGPPAGTLAAPCPSRPEPASLHENGPAVGAGNPIDLVTGNKYRRDVDYERPGPLGQVFARHYNSRNRHGGPLGVGWSHSLETRLVARPTQTPEVTEIQVIQGDGRRRVFSRVDDASATTGGDVRRYRGLDVAHGIVEHDPLAPNPWRWRWPGGRALDFDSHGRLAAVRRDGVEAIRLHYDERARLTRIDTGHGLGFVLAYADLPVGERLVRVELPGGHAIGYRFDDVGQLSSVQYPDGRMRHYVYDDAADPLLLGAVLEADGRALARYRYDSQGRAVSTEGADADEAITVAYPPSPAPSTPGIVRGRTRVTDPHGRQATYLWHYDRHRHATRILEARGQACARCPPSPRRYRYDRDGRLTATEAPQGRVRHVYDALGRPTAAWQDGPLGWRQAWELAYGDDDPLALPASIAQPSVAPGRRHTIDIVRDAWQRPVRIDERGFAPRAPAAGDLQARARGHRPGPVDRYEPIQRSVSLGYTPDDAAPHAGLPGHLAFIDGPLPGDGDRIDVLRTERALRLRYGVDVEESLRFADDGEVLEHRPPDGVPVRFVLPSPGGLYRAHGGPLQAWRAASLLSFGYRTDGALLGIVRSGGATADRVAAGRVAADPVAAGRGGPARVGAAHAVTTRTDEPPSAIRATAFWRGRPTSVVLPDGTRFSRGFDDFGRVAWIDNPGQPREWARYDEADRLAWHRLADGSSLTHVRDPLGRLVRSTATGTDGTSQLRGTYRWDGTRLVEARNDAVTSHYAYDGDGRLAAVTHTLAAGTPAAERTTLRFDYDHDLRGRLAQERLPGGITLQYRYDGARAVAVEVVGPGFSKVLDASDRSVEPAPRDDRANGDRARGDRANGGRARSAGPRGTPPRRRYLAGRLVALEDAGSTRTLARYAHSPHGTRAAKTVLAPRTAPEHTRFVHHDWRLRAEVDPRGTARHVIWLGAVPVGLIEGGRLFDLRGGDAGHAPLALRAPGQYFDAESGWHYNHWRTFDPATSRYLEPDPLGLQGGYTDRHSLFAHARPGSGPTADPWGLARISYFALTTGSDGRSLGRVQGFDRARWSFLVEDIEPLPAGSANQARPGALAAGTRLLFDPFGDFVGGRDDPGLGSGNGVDAIVWQGGSGRDVLGAFVAHYADALLAPSRFVVDGFDDGAATRLLDVLMRAPDERRACVPGALSLLPAIDFGPGQPLLSPVAPAAGVLPRVLECRRSTAVPLAWRDDVERERVERYEAAAELQESPPAAAIARDCSADTGCRSRTAIRVNGRTYYASYGRTQFTVNTFLGQLGSLTSPGAGLEGQALARALGLAEPVIIDGQAATLAAVLERARLRVARAYEQIPQLRREFGRGVDAGRARTIWSSLPDAQRRSFSAQTGLGEDAFVDILGYVATGGPYTEEEGRHAIAAQAAFTVAYQPATSTSPAVVPGAAAMRSFSDWMIELFASRDRYDHVSRAFLRDNLRTVLAHPGLQGRFDNPHAPGTPQHRDAQQAIERDLARRIAILHNSGRLDLASAADAELALRTRGPAWLRSYVEQFLATDGRGDWESLRCADGLAGRAGLQFTSLARLR